MVSKEYACQTDLILPFKYVHFTVCQLYLNKVISKISLENRLSIVIYNVIAKM